MQRVHVVTEPLSDYIRFELTGYAPNVEAGEDVRVISVREGEPWPADRQTCRITTTGCSIRTSSSSRNVITNPIG